LHISQLTIRNFRNFRNATFTFKKGVNTLIGENGSGKTNALYAIRLLIDDSLPRRANQLHESDFTRAVDNWKGHWIIISIDFEELDASEGCQIIRHHVGHMNTENKGTYTFFFRPNKEIRNTLFDMSGENVPKEEIKSFINSITIEQYAGIFRGRAAGDFSDDQTYRSIVGNFHELNFPDPNEEDSEIVGVPAAALHKEVACTFVKALRDVVSDLRGYRDNPLLSLLRGSEKNIEVADTEKIIDSVRQLNEDISELDEIKNIASGIQETLDSTVGNTYSPEIDIKSSLPEDIEKLLQRLSLKVGDAYDGDYQGDLTELSLGSINLIFLALKLLEYEYKLSTDRVAHFLLIEEPEAHIHTHIQMTLFEKYKYGRTQVIVSTHSTHVSAASKISSVNILAKNYQHANVFHPSAGLRTEECERIDLDTSVVKLPEEPDNDDLFQMRCRKSELSGEKRKEKLERFCNGNKLVRAFYANHTFEIDFLQNDNVWEIEQSLPQIYQKQSKIDTVSQKLKDDDIAVAGREILKVANTYGKGWFALIVSEHVNHSTSIPHYILQALAFATHDTINEPSLKVMGLYRIRERAEDEDFKVLAGEIDTLKNQFQKCII